VATVRLDRAEKLNRLDVAKFDALITVGTELIDRDDVGAVVLIGAGRAVWAELDLGSFSAMADDDTGRVDVPREPLGAARVRGRQAVHLWSPGPAPVIAAAHGVAFGGGLQIALGADPRIGAPDAQLSIMEVQLGLVPDMCGTQPLPDLVGRDVAKELPFTRPCVRDGGGAVPAGHPTVGRPARRGARARLGDRRPEPQRHPRREATARHGRTRAARPGLQAEQDEITALVGSPEQVAIVRRQLGIPGR
jgi:hypothetical protein